MPNLQGCKISGIFLCHYTWLGASVWILVVSSIGKAEADGLVAPGKPLIVR